MLFLPIDECVAMGDRAFRTTAATQNLLRQASDRPIVTDSLALMSGHYRRAIIYYMRRGDIVRDRALHKVASRYEATRTEGFRPALKRAV